MTARALVIPEVLENILLGLPIKDLLFAQKVCTTWKQVMEGSPGIQRALFLLPGATTDVDLACIDDPMREGLDHVLQTKGVALNQLLLTTTNLRLLRDKISLPGYFAFKSTIDQADSSDSCHKMYITQPPSRIKALYYVEELPDDPDSIEFDEIAGLTSDRLEVETGDRSGATVGDMVKEYEHKKPKVEKDCYYPLTVWEATLEGVGTLGRSTRGGWQMAKSFDQSHQDAGLQMDVAARMYHVTI
ncbi:hypothetical protein LTR10_006255 [Elasticomyces elasticus]|nr:hypothetical protein LTR10_006255 [Elasticomyces elasticus]KAK4966695.1 hypothetical protein LTR42_011006 [Elasticomyces elasticus]